LEAQSISKLSYAAQSPARIRMNGFEIKRHGNT
jgi:hypothetical protein